MRKLISATLVAAIASISMISSASAGEGYAMGPNGRLTYWNDGQPGYVVVERQRTLVVRRHHYHRRDPVGEAIGTAIIGLAAGAIIGGIANNQRQASDQAFINTCLKASRSLVQKPDGTLVCR